MIRTRAIRTLVALVAIGFFAAPITARVAGVKPEAFENRRFAEAPRLAQGWSAFQQATQFLIDRMPLRAQAVRLNGEIWRGAFGTDPLASRGRTLGEDRALPFAGTTEQQGAVGAGAVAGVDAPVSASTGRSGWFFLDEELEYACDRAPNRPILRRWGRILGAIAASGRPAVMLVPPAKASVYPEYLPEEYPFDHCALEAKERFWKLLADEGPNHRVIELRSDLLRLKEHAGDLLFQRKDSHWSTLGALTLVKAALKAVGDGVRLEPDEIVRRGSVSYLGDLAVVGGQGDRDQRMEYAIERSPGAPRVPGRTLLICDSFAGEWMRLLRPYFEDIHCITLSAEGLVGTMREIRRADRVVFESMELFWKGDDSRELAEELRRWPL